jgi:hypothetical protein
MKTSKFAPMMAQVTMGVRRVSLMSRTGMTTGHSIARQQGSRSASC